MTPDSALTLLTSSPTCFSVSLKSQPVHEVKLATGCKILHSMTHNYTSDKCESNHDELTQSVHGMCRGPDSHEVDKALFFPFLKRVEKNGIAMNL